MRLLLLTLFLFRCCIAECQKISRPKLVIGIVVDQMRWDYLYRYYDRYSENGFKRLLREGFNYENTFIPYTPSVTSVGHASIYTGSIPAIHGIVGNDWVDRQTKLSTYSCSDKNVKGIGTNSTEGKMSPVHLMATSIGDELRLSNNFKSRVFSISLKNRGAILAGGRSANAAYWLEDISGNWISSSWYMQQLPAWVTGFNNRKFTDSFLNKTWDPMFPQITYVNSLPDGKGYKKQSWNKDNSFPHVFKNGKARNYADIRYSPFGNTLTLKMARELLVNEKAGDSLTDMLCISLSSTDYITHEYGVNSIETEDNYLRLDRDLAAFLSFLDEKYGNDYLLFLTADHGGLESPGFFKEHQLSSGHLYTWALPDELNRLLTPGSSHKIVTAVMENQIYLDHQLIDSLHMDSKVIKKILSTHLIQKKEILNVLDYEHPEQWNIPQNLRELFMNGYYRSRSGDLQIILKPEFSDNSDVGTEHGSVFNYDTHIPLLFCGWHIPKGQSYRKVYITDIAATVSALLHIQMPGGSIGNPLTEILSLQ